MTHADSAAKWRAMVAGLPATTDVDRALAIRSAIEREVTLAGGTRGISAATWDEIKGETLESLLSANTDALTDDLFDLPGDSPEQEADAVRILHMIKVGSELLGAGYLASVLESGPGASGPPAG